MLLTIQVQNATFSVGIKRGWATGERHRSSCPLFVDIRLSLGERVQGEGRYQPVEGKWGELTQNLLGTGNGVRKEGLPGPLTTEWPGNSCG